MRGEAPASLPSSASAPRRLQPSAAAHALASAQFEAAPCAAASFAAPAVATARARGIKLQATPTASISWLAGSVWILLGIAKKTEFASPLEGSAHVEWIEQFKPLGATDLVLPRLTGAGSDSAMLQPPAGQRIQFVLVPSIGRVGEARQRVADAAPAARAARLRPKFGNRCQAGGAFRTHQILLCRAAPFSGSSGDEHKYMHTNRSNNC
eukprot:357179-Chlamydomonas_euryale.AAC.11